MGKIGWGDGLRNISNCQVLKLCVLYEIYDNGTPRTANQDFGKVFG